MASESTGTGTETRLRKDETHPLKEISGTKADGSPVDAEQPTGVLDYGTRSVPETEPGGVDPSDDNDDYTVNDAIDTIGVGFLQIAILLTSFLAMIAVFAQTLLSTTINEILRCTFKLTDEQAALISTMLFVGELLGAYPISKLVDVYGRRPGLIIITTLMFIYSALISVAPNYTWVLILRLIAGVCVVGVQSSFILYLGEITPSSFRALFVLGQVLFFGIGSVYLATLGYLVLPYYGWRIQCICTALPIIPVISVVWTFPESPRYFALTGSIRTAVDTIKKIAERNQVKLPEGKLIQATRNDKEQPSSVVQLLSPALRRKTIMLWVIWFCVYFCYLGIALSSGRLIRITSPLPPTANDTTTLDSTTNSNVTLIVRKQIVPKHSTSSKVQDIELPDSALDPHPRMTSPFCKEEDKEPVECEVVVSNAEYVEAVIASVGDFFAAPAIVALVYVFGRKGGMSISLLLGASFILCIIVSLGEIPPIAFIFVTRALTLGTYGGLFLYTLEAYPTSTRSMALATGLFFAKIGGALTPFIAESFIKQSPVDALLIYFFVCFTGSIMVCLLPMETIGMDLKDS
ncbi:putative transporter SVOPL [Asterias rubens]|uniref:putative transporter SVOPL n=1 Tax=Asterias rubens TaxID=7604 RepID=UPI001454F072|nr:putative transporter SVOPL [Asterias rubens]XP_033626976.1 putative transporter SVOPL [Asterias rubens]